MLVLKTLLNDSDTEDTSARISVIIKPDETFGKQKEEEDNSFMENTSNRVSVIVSHDKISGEQKEGGEELDGPSADVPEHPANKDILSEEDREDIMILDKQE